MQQNDAELQGRIEGTVAAIYSKYWGEATTDTLLKSIEEDTANELAKFVDGPSVTVISPDGMALEFYVEFPSSRCSIKFEPRPA